MHAADKPAHQNADFGGNGKSQVVVKEWTNGARVQIVKGALCDGFMSRPQDARQRRVTTLPGEAGEGSVAFTDSAERFDGAGQGL